MLLDQRIAYNVTVFAKNVAYPAAAQAGNHMRSVPYQSHCFSSFSQGTQSSISQFDSLLADRFL